MPEPRRGGADWTPADEDVLREEIAAGAGWQYRAAERLERMPGACYLRARTKHLFTPHRWVSRPPKEEHPA